MTTDAELRNLAENVATWEPWHRGDVVDTLATGILALLDRIDAVRALHLEAQMGFVVNLCRECHHTWPCPTIRLLDGAE